MQKEGLKNWDLISFVSGSDYRFKILELLSTNPLTPTMMKNYIHSDIYYISALLRDLKSNRLVECVNEKRNKTRYYQITEIGKSVFKHTKDILFNGQENIQNEKGLYEAIFNNKIIKKLTHDFFPYPARFPPSIPEYFIKNMHKTEKRILDPFCGGGTVQVECSILGKECVGIDLNKLGIFLAEVKTTTIAKDRLEKAYNDIKIKFAKEKKPSYASDSIFSEKDVNYIPTNMRIEIKTLKKIIDSFPDKIRNFYLVCLISVCNDVLSNRKGIVHKEIMPLFCKKSEYMIKSMEQYSKLKKTDVISLCGDCREELKKYPDGYFDMVITSPPYPDVHIEYSNLMLEGRRGSKLLYNLMDYKEVRSSSDYRMNNGKKYFDLMDSCLSQITRVLRNGKKAIFIIGFKRKTYKTRFIKLCKDHNLKLIKSYTRAIPNRKWYNSLPEKKGKGIPLELVLVFKKYERKNDMSKYDWETLQLLHKRHLFDYLTHNYHEYRGSFIPMIPKKAIYEFLRRKKIKNAVILDNFGGCGTTAVEARLHDYKIFSVDYNILATLIAKVKSTPLNPVILKKYSENFLIKIEKEFSSKNPKSLLPNFPDQTKWFHKDVLKELGIIFYHIKNLEMFSPEKYFNHSQFKDFLLVAFSSILIKVANPTNFNFVTDNMLPKKERYVDVYKIFKETLYSMIEQMGNFYNKIKNKEPSLSKIYCYDSRKLTDINGLTENSVDLAITSPPYLNGLDYARMHRLSYYWLFNKEWQKWLKEESEIGARFKRAKSDCVENYFRDIKVCFENVFKVLKKDAYYVVVINDTYYRKKHIKTHERFIKIAEEIGFSDIKTKKVLIPGHFYKDHGKEFEWVIFMKK
jgi:DNA modification methylase